MTNVVKLLRMSFSTILFCTGLFLLIHNAEVLRETLSVIRENDQNMQIYSQNVYMDQNIITYAELIATLCNKLEYNIEIDGVTIQKDNMTPEKIQELKIMRKDYEKSYDYDTDGNIVKIIYSSRKL